MNHNNKHIRHAEKRRIATCHFANRMATASIQHYHSAVKHPPTATVLATIVAYDSRKNQCTVLSMGVGTKFNTTNGIRDCHAEVLARRGMKRWLLNELATIQLTGTSRWLKKTCTDSLATTTTDSTRTSTQYQFQPQFSLHFYTSTAPCGNATVKKFATLQKEVFREMHLWPTYLHERIPPHSVSLGQFALLSKGSANTTTDKNSARRSHNMFIPPGTQLPTCDNSHTCSDKMLQWNHLGWQGSLASRWITVHVTSVTVGRKFSQHCTRRAICCRGSRDTVHHPAIMGTDVYLDQRVIGQDHTAAFANHNYIWWLGLDAPECLDGTTGLLLDHTPSQASTPALVQLYCQMTHQPMPTNILVFKRQGPYEERKRELYQSHPVLKGWKRRTMDSIDDTTQQEPVK